jgi:hypothetical protein
VPGIENFSGDLRRSPVIRQNSGGHKSRPITMLQAHLHAIHFKRILDFGEGQDSYPIALITHSSALQVFMENARGQ